MFRSYSNKFKYNLRDKLDISELINIIGSDMENTLLEFWTFRLFCMNFMSGVFSSKTLVSILILAGKSVL